MGYRRIPLRRMKVVGVLLTIIGCVLLQDYNASGSAVKTVSGDGGVAWRGVAGRGACGASIMSA